MYPMYPPPPYGAPPPPRRLLVERVVLDEQMAESRRVDPRPWGVRPWLLPLLTLVVIVVLANVAGVAAFGNKHGTARIWGGIALTFLAELALLFLLLAIGEPIARRTEGWRRTFGLDWVRRTDWLPWVLGICFVFVGRLVVGLLAYVFSHGSALAQANNVRLANPTVAEVVVLAVPLVIVGPVAEELMFRGLILRTFMRRMPFWPAAVLSTLLFGLAHTYEVATLAGALTLAASVGVLGLVNCYLVRITGRLTPGMMLHATANGVAVLYLALTAAH
jgi:membrane protease YdiL (CAAX protease family)